MKCISINPNIYVQYEQCRPIVIALHVCGVCHETYTLRYTRKVGNSDVQCYSSYDCTW